MAINYTKLKNRIVPKPDGQDEVTLRTALVDTVNADGTVDIILSGIIVPSVPKLASAIVDDDQVVQVASYRGSLMVLGSTGISSGVAGEQPVVRDAAQSSSSASTAEIVVSTLASYTYKAGRAYKVWVGGGVTYSANSVFSSWRIRKGTTTAGASVKYFPRQSNGASNGTNEMHLNLQAIFVVGATDVTTQLCLCMAASGGTAMHTGNTDNERHLSILPAGYASEWTNASVLS